MLHVLRTSRSSSSNCHPCGLWHSPRYLCRCSLCLPCSQEDVLLGCITASGTHPPASLPMLGHPHPIPDGLEGASHSPCCALEKSLFPKGFFHGVCWPGEPVRAVRSLRLQSIVLPLAGPGELLARVPAARMNSRSAASVTRNHLPSASSPSAINHELLALRRSRSDFVLEIAGECGPYSVSVLFLLKRKGYCSRNICGPGLPRHTLSRGLFLLQAANEMVL